MEPSQPPARLKADPYKGQPRAFLKRHDFNSGLHSTKSLLRDLRLETVCESARCPNISECFSRPTATFMILGRECTRRCVFCSVDHAARPAPPELDEPQRLAEAAERMRLRHIVITSVARDDLPDEGAGHFTECVQALRERNTGVTVEILTPDFQRDQRAAAKTIAESPPDIFNHNIETVERLQKYVRPYAGYASSLSLLGHMAAVMPGMPIKSGLMLGLGETASEIETTLGDLLAAGATDLTIGQYFQPTRRNAVVQRYADAAEFDHWRTVAAEMGFRHVASGAYVRSSYFADKALEPDTLARHTQERPKTQ